MIDIDGGWRETAIEMARALIEYEGLPHEDGWFAYDPNYGDKTNWNLSRTILEANGMLERHETNADWVRIRSDEDE